MRPTQPLGPVLGDYSVNDTIFDMSEDVSECNDKGLDNLVAVRISAARLNPDFAKFGGPDRPPTTFVLVDFYDFDSQMSEVHGGYQPTYAFTAQYPVLVGPLFREELQNEHITIELYAQDGTQGELVASCQIRLRDLLLPAAAIRGTVQLLSPAAVGTTGHVSKDMIAGELQYQIRMLRPLVERPLSPTHSISSFVSFDGDANGNGGGALGNDDNAMSAVSAAVKTPFVLGSMPVLPPDPRADAKRVRISLDVRSCTLGPAHNIVLYARNPYYGVDAAMEQEGGDGQSVLHFSIKDQNVGSHEVLELFVADRSAPRDSSSGGAYSYSGKCRLPLRCGMVF